MRRFPVKWCKLKEGGFLGALFAGYQGRDSPRHEQAQQNAYFVATEAAKPRGVREANATKYVFWCDCENGGGW